MHTRSITPFVVVALAAYDAPLGAYLDPGSGSMLLQVLLGGFAAVGVIAKLYWRRLIGVIRRTDDAPDRT